MSSLDAFEAVLKEVVQAKRLSASKMGRLTDIALKSMQNDTQLVSILYRTHKSLPPAAKVPSLYIFDALSRAARHQVNKQALTGDANSEHGNCATFLLKVEGVLDGLFQDMIMVGSPESKEKTKKILDIWSKENTFPSNVLLQITEVVKEAEKEPEVISVTPADPRTLPLSTPNATPPPIPPLPPSITVDPQAALLALLTQAASVASNPNGQTPTNTSGPTAGPSLDSAQLALLHQLTQTAKLSGGTPSQPATLAVPSAPRPGPPQGAFSGSNPSQSPPPYDSFRDDNYTSRREPRYDKYNSPDRGRGNDGRYDDRAPSRGSYRGSFRGRGRGDRGRWDERDRFSDRGRDWSPPRRTRHSRSRSPPSRYGAKRDLKPYSPPRRTNFAPLTSRDQMRSTELVSPALNPGKDEFGRDIRPQSPTDTPSVAASKEALPQPKPLPVSVDIPSVDPAPPPSTHNQMSFSSVAANTISPPSDIGVSSAPGIDKFDPTTFDFTSPASWEALGEMWKVTYGYLPSTEELMQFISGALVPATVTSQSSVKPQNWSDPSQSGSVSQIQSWQMGKGRGSYPRGRGGGYGRGISRDGHDYGDTGHDTDAIVLGGGDDSDDMDISTDQTNDILTTTEERSGGLGGRMQRIGEKWIFVKDEVSAAMEHNI